MYHSAAVVGINTTAEIESAIVGRGVYTVLAPEFRDTQEGTLHFQHLRRADGGLVHVADERRGAPASSWTRRCAARTTTTARCRRFVEAFVRPHGLDVPATPQLVEALEALAARAPSPVERPAVWAPCLRPAWRRARAPAGAATQPERRRGAKRECGAARRRTSARRSPEAGRARGAARADSRTSEPWRDLATELSRARVRRSRAFRRRDRGAARRREVQLETIRPERLDYPHADIYLRVTSKAERNRLRACAKEPFTIDWIEHASAPATCSTTSAPTSAPTRWWRPRSPAAARASFAFEPSYANVASLCANIVLNDVDRPRHADAGGAVGLRRDDHVAACRRSSRAARGTRWRARPPRRAPDRASIEQPVLDVPPRRR